MPASPPHSALPRKPALLNELGQRQTPPCGPETFQILGSGPQIIVLGLGPDPAVAVEVARGLKQNNAGAGEATDVIYVDCPDFTDQIAETGACQLPSHWRTVNKEEAIGFIQRQTSPAAATFVLYLPGLRLFPSFFGPLFGAAWAATARPGKTPSPRPQSGRARYNDRAIRSVTLVGSERDLLHRELRLALAEEGLDLKFWNPEEARGAQGMRGTAVAAPPEDSLGDLFLSVNFKGLDPWGATYHYLRARDIAVAVWCVDNPWHLLSGLRAPYWRELPLFVTDASFLPGLKAHGAQRVRHLPLAACPALFATQPGGAAPQGEYLRDLAPLVFIGRTAFPDRDKFFAAQHLPDTLLSAALDSLETGAAPDFLYWAKALGISRLWPGQEARRAGLAAEECARRRRTVCVRAALRQTKNTDAPGITIFGDAAWRDELADFPSSALDLRGTVDYYTELPALYRAAELVLNITSLLLPAGLNQRHFDVWMSGAAQLCNASPGLDIFPEELVRPLLFHKPGDIPRRAAELLGQPGLLRSLKHDWKALLAAEHTYTQRVRTILAEL